MFFLCRAAKYNLTFPLPRGYISAEKDKFPLQLQITTLVSTPQPATQFTSQGHLYRYPSTTPHALRSAAFCSFLHYLGTSCVRKEIPSCKVRCADLPTLQLLFELLRPINYQHFLVHTSFPEPEVALLGGPVSSRSLSLLGVIGIIPACTQLAYPVRTQDRLVCCHCISSWITARLLTKWAFGFCGTIQQLCSENRLHS